MLLTDLLSLPDANGWSRPPDWPQMPPTAANQIDILVAVFNNSSNYVGMNVTVTGGYTVDWGDGTVDTHASASVANHQYNHSSLSSPVLSEGYKTCMVKVTPTTAGNNITNFNLAARNTRTGFQNGALQPWLDIQANTPAATNAFFGQVTTTSLAQRVNAVSVGACLPMFYTMPSLKSVLWGSSTLTATAILDNAFNTTAVEHLEFPAGSLATVTSLTSSFRGMPQLRYVRFPPGSLNNVTTIGACFLTDPELVEIVFPAGWNPTSLVTTTNAFGTCPSLSRIQNCNIPVSFSVASCKLAGDALDEIFTALPTVTGQTITITGNHGVPDCHTSIATAKGWTVTT